jgi:hypothetical protein
MVNEVGHQRSFQEGFAGMLAISFGPAFLVAILLTVLGATYVWSPNADHRDRARELILILLGGVSCSEGVLAALDMDPINGSDSTGAQSNE